MLIRDISSLTVPQLIEVAQQLDVGMFAHLPKDWQNPGVAGLCAFRILADSLSQNRSQNSADANQFLDAIEQTSKLALDKLDAEGTKAFIKPLINKLFEYAGGFQRQDYTSESFKPIANALAEEKLSTDGQLIYRKKDGRFFSLVDPGYIEAAQKNYGNKDRPKAEINHAHFTVNEGMAKDQSERIFKQYEQELGITEKPLFKIENADIVYLNKSISFRVVGAYQGIPKTNSRMAGTHQLHIVSTELEGLTKKDGLGCFFPDYRNHITFAEQSRKPYPALEKVGLIIEVLSEGELSGRLKSVIANQVLVKNVEHKVESSGTTLTKTKADVPTPLEKQLHQVLPVQQGAPKKTGSGDPTLFAVKKALNIRDTSPVAEKTTPTPF